MQAKRNTKPLVLEKKDKLNLSKSPSTRLSLLLSSWITLMKWSLPIIKRNSGWRQFFRDPLNHRLPLVISSSRQEGKKNLCHLAREHALWKRRRSRNEGDFKDDVWAWPLKLGCLINTVLLALHLWGMCAWMNTEA